MASAFNLTAQINIAGPANIKPVVGKIQKQLQGIKATVDIKLDKRVASQLRSINKNMTALNTSLKAVNRTAKGTSRGLNAMASSSVSNKIARTSQSMNALSRATKNSGNTLQNTNKQLQKSSNLMQAFGKHVGLAAKKFAAFSLVTGIIYRVSNAIDVAVSEFVAFDRELVKISQVTGTSMKGLGGLEKTIRNLSTSLGVSSQALIKVSTTLAQAGLTANQTKQALQALARADLAPTFGDMNDTVEGSIALMRQFSISTKELESALGSINAVASQFAVESQDIMVAIKRAGGVFAAASKGVAEGTDALNQFIAIFTSVRATTREGAETIATGLRTIFTRIQRGDTIEKLRAIGVELTDMSGKFVGPFEAVRRLSAALASLDPRDTRFAAIAEELGGFRQIGKVIPLLQQFSTAQAAYFTAQKGGNSLLKDSTLAQQALAVQIQKTREQFVSFVASLANNQGLKNIATLALKAANAILKITEAMGPAMPALAILLGGTVAKMGVGMLTGRKFATGGMVPGSGNRDTVPAMLTPGEFVIRKKAVGAIGADNLHQMNKYATGGPIKAEKLKKRSVALRNRVVSESSSVPESDFKSGKYLTDSDMITFNKQEYGLAAAKNIGSKNFEKKVAARIGGGLQSKHTAPIDVVKGRRKIEVRNRNRPTRDVELLDKLLRYNLQSKGKLINNRKQGEALHAGRIDVAYNTNKLKRKGLKTLASGGGISGSDTVPALLTPGEFVINKKAASRIGASKLHSMNQADRITGYNKGGFVGFSKGGKARKDAATIAQAQQVNPKVMKDVEARLKSSGLAAEEVRAALVAFARSINKGEDIQTAKNKAIGAAGAQQQGVGHQSTRMAKKGIQQQAQFSQTGQGAPQADPTAVRQKAMASTGVQTGIAKQQLEGKFGAGTKAAENALKVFKHELAATGSRTQAFSAALSAGQKHATVLSTGFAKLKTNAATFGQKLSTISMSVAKTTAKFSGLSLVATSFKNVFKGPIGALKKFGMAVNRASGGRLGKMVGGGGNGMGGMVAGMALEMAGGAVVSMAANAAKSGGDDTDASRMISGVGGGALTGAAAGAMIGSVVPVIGTALGGLAGGIIGGVAGYFSAQKENANAQAQAVINAADKFTKRSGQALDRMSNMQLSATDRAQAEGVFLQSQRVDAGVQANRKMSAMNQAGMSSSERAQAFSGEATQAVKYFATKAQQSGKSMDELKATMDPQAYANLERSILLADEGYQKTLDAHGNETVASGQARIAALKYARETSKTNAALYRNRMAIMAMNKVAMSFKKAAEDMNGAMDTAARNLEYDMANANMILDPTAMAAPRTKSLDVINNAASSGAERQAAYRNIAGNAFGSAGGKLAAQAALPQTLEESLRKARADSPQGDRAKNMAGSAESALIASGIDPSQAGQIAKDLQAKLEEMSPEELANIDIGDLIKGDPKLTALLQGAEDVGKALKRYGEMTARSLQILSDVAVKTAEMEQANRDRTANYVGERMANEDRMNAILGKGQNLQAKLNRINEKGAAQRSIRTGVNESNPVAAAQRLSDNVQGYTLAKQINEKNMDAGMLKDEGDVQKSQAAYDEQARLGQAAATARQELEKIPGQLQSSIDAVLSEMESVMAHRSAQISAGAGLMEKALSSTPSEMMKMSKTMNLASAAAQGFAPTIQQSEAAQKAYAQTIRGGGSQRQAQSAAQQAYAQESSDSLSMLKEMMPLLTAAGPEGKAEANKMMAKAYESQFAARGIDINQTPFGKIIEMMKQDPAQDPQIAALQEQYKLLEEQKAQTTEIINQLDQKQIQAYRKEAAQGIIDEIRTLRESFKDNQKETAAEGGTPVAASGPAKGVPGSTPSSKAAAGAAAAGSGAAGSSAGGGAAGSLAGGGAGSSSSIGSSPPPSSSTASAGPTRQQRTIAYAQRMQQTYTSQGQYNNAASQGHASMMQQRRIAYARSTGNTKGLRDEDKKFMAAQNLENRAREQGSEGPGASTGRVPSGNRSRGGSPTSSTAQNQSNGVNTSGLAQFTEKLNNLFTQLANVSIPSEINLTGAFDVNVKLNGAEVLAKIEPRVKEMILEHTGQEINQFAADNFGGEGKSKKVPLGKSADQPTTA